MHDARQKYVFKNRNGFVMDLKEEMRDDGISEEEILNILHGLD